MAETDILNPQTGYWAALGDNPNPSYGFTRKTNANSLLSKTRLGSWYQRDNMNSGYAFPMSYMLRPWTTMLMLKQFYEIGKNGYFTFIDYDGGDRNHVGRFTTDPDPIQVQNAKYNCQNLIFEEVPQARMLAYPSNFTDWGKNIYVVNDYLKQAPATQGAWVLQQLPAIQGAYPVTAPSGYELYDATPSTTASDFAQIQYVGWGFMLSLRMGAALGICDVYVDGALAVQGLDLYNGTANALIGYQTLGLGGALAAPVLTITQDPPIVVNPVLPNPRPVAPGQPISEIIVHSPGSYTEFFYHANIVMTAMPLDNHRVKVVPRGAKNIFSAGTGVAFPGLQVIV